MKYNKKEVWIILGVSLFIILGMIILFLFSKKTYTVRFNTNGGKEIKSIKVSKGKEIGTLPIAEKDGYSFLYWKSGDLIIDENYKVDKSLKLDAIFELKITEEKIYKITFDTVDGSEIPSQEVKENEKIKYPGEPIKDGYKFKMWTINEEAIDFSKPVTGDLNLKAEYEKVTTTKKIVTTKKITTTRKITTTTKKVNIACMYDRELSPGAEYVYGDYTYIYKQEIVDDVYLNNSVSYKNINSDGWWAISTESLKALRSINSYNGPSYITSTSPITSILCKTISGKPIVSIRYMFAYSNANSIDLSSFNTSNVTDMSYMFYKNKTSDLNLKSFNTSRVVNMSRMFLYSKASSLDLSSFNTSSVTDMKEMFKNSEASTVNLKSFNTSKVTNMSLMFANTSSQNLDLKSFNTSNVQDMSGMFISSSAKKIDLSNFNTSKVTKMDLMFSDSKTDILDLSTFDTSNVESMKHMFLNAKATTGYARSKIDATRLNNASWSLSNGKCPENSLPSTLTFVVK